MLKRFGIVVAVLAVALLALVPAAFAQDSTLLYSFTPSSAETNSSVTMTLYGEGLWNIGGGPTQVWLSPPGQGWLHVADATNFQTVGSDGSQARVTFGLWSVQPGTYDVWVSTDWGGSDWQYGFQVTNPAPTVPVVYAIIPATVQAGTGAFQLSVIGANFQASPQSRIQWNGQDLATSYSSATSLQAIVPGTYIAQAGTATIRVVNPGPTSAISNSLTLTISAPAPSVSSITPTQVWADSLQPTTLTVNGSNFVQGSKILLNGTEKSNTTYVSSSQLTVALAESDISAPMNIVVSVRNPGNVTSSSSATLQVVAETSVPVVSIVGADSAWHNQSVTLTVNATDSQSGIQKVQYQMLPSMPNWTTGTSVVVPAPANHSNDGVITVNVQAYDWCNNMGSATAQVFIDTTPPQTAALQAVTVTRGKNATLRYMVSEPANLSPTAVVTLKIKSMATGSSVKTFNLGTKAMNQALSYTFKCNLAKGNYRYYVYATDLAGNQQQSAASNALKVQ